MGDGAYFVKSTTPRAFSVSMFRKENNAHKYFLHIYNILNLANFRPMHIMDNGYIGHIL